MVAERSRLVLNSQGTAKGWPPLAAQVQGLDLGWQPEQMERFWTRPGLAALGPRRVRGQASKLQEGAQVRWQHRILRRASDLVRARRAFRMTGATTGQELRKAGPEMYLRPVGLPAPYVPFTAMDIAEPEPREPTASMDELL